MCYAHLSPAFLFAEVGLRDSPAPPKTKSTRATFVEGDQRGAKMVKFPRELAPQTGLDQQPSR
jgi:hypothetical protein